MFDKITPMSCTHIDFTYLDSQQDVPGMYVRIQVIIFVTFLINASSEMLKSDMKSLTEEGTGSSLNLQQRVISSGIQLCLCHALPNETHCEIGLESMTGSDAPKIISLFKGMAVYAEDQIIAVTFAF